MGGDVFGKESRQEKEEERGYARKNQIG